jgi:hypothetical protein
VVQPFSGDQRNSGASFSLVLLCKNHLAHRVSGVEKDVVPIVSRGENDSEGRLVHDIAERLSRIGAELCLDSRLIWSTVSLDLAHRHEA